MLQNVMCYEKVFSAKPSIQGRSIFSYGGYGHIIYRRRPYFGQTKIQLISVIRNIFRYVSMHVFSPSSFQSKTEGVFLFRLFPFWISPLCSPNPISSSRARNHRILRPFTKHRISGTPFVSPILLLLSQCIVL